MAETTQRGRKREGGRKKGFQGAAGSRSTQTDAVKAALARTEGAGNVRVCVSVCVCAHVMVLGEGGQIVNTTAQLLLQQTIHAMIKSLRE